MNPFKGINEIIKDEKDGCWYYHETRLIKYLISSEEELNRVTNFVKLSSKANKLFFTFLFLIICLEIYYCNTHFTNVFTKDFENHYQFFYYFFLFVIVSFTIWLSLKQKAAIQGLQKIKTKPKLIRVAIAILFLFFMYFWVEPQLKANLNRTIANTPVIESSQK